MHSASRPERPLSPFLTVYRWQYTMALSILHRFTGAALSAGLILFAYWLVAAASGAQAYAQALGVFGHPLLKVMLAGFSFAFFFHLLNGVRHLTWDAGYGLERKAARLSGWIVFLGALAVTGLFWGVALARFGGGAQ